MIILFFAVLVVIAVVLQRYTASKSIEKLDVSIEISNALTEPDEAFDICLNFANRGRWFIPYLKYTVLVPNEMETNVAHGGIASGLRDQRYFSGTTWLLPRQKLTKKIEVTMPKRGRYIFSSMRVYGGDFLGINEEGKTLECMREVVVYPNAAPRAEIDAVFGGFLGEMSVNRFIMEDPVLTLGYRDYTGSEPLKSISWKQSARMGSLMVKKYDYTLEPTVAVLMNCDTPDEDREELLERCFRLCRTVCQELEDRGIKYSFRTNVLTAGALTNMEFFSEGLGRAHFCGIMECLGRAMYMCRYSCARLLEKLERSGEGTSGVIFITPDSGAGAAEARRAVERMGGTILVLSAKEAELC